MARREDEGGRNTGEGEEKEEQEGDGCREEEGREEGREGGMRKAVARAGRDTRTKRRRKGLWVG